MRPKLSDGETMPSPKSSCQMRFTMTRATSPLAGVSGSVSQWAKARRRPLLFPFAADSEIVTGFPGSVRTLRNPGSSSVTGVS